MSQRATPGKRPASLIIRNPHVLDRIAEFRKQGIGRGYTETAENLILTGADTLRERERTEQILRGDVSRSNYEKASAV